MTKKDGPRSVSRRKLVRLASTSALTVVAGSVVTGCTVLDALDADRYAVTITGGGRYEPTTLTVPVGATVVWRNMDEVPHSVANDPDALEDSSRVSMPDGAEPLDSGDIMTGDRFSHTFTVAGTYVYTCGNHPGENTIGTVTVEEDGG